MEDDESLKLFSNPQEFLENLLKKSQELNKREEVKEITEEEWMEEYGDRMRDKYGED